MLALETNKPCHPRVLFFKDLLPSGVLFNMCIEKKHARGVREITRSICAIFLRSSRIVEKITQEKIPSFVIFENDRAIQQARIIITKKEMLLRKF